MGALRAASGRGERIGRGQVDAAHGGVKILGLLMHPSSPDAVDQALNGHRLTRVEEEHAEQRTFAPTECNDTLARLDLEWTEDPRLRTAVGDASRIQTRVPGYLVTCSDEELDALLFSRLTAAARTAAAADDHADALRSYEQALALWRGDAPAGVELEGDAQIDVARLDLERRVVAEERLDSALALGRHAQLIPELERRVRDEPLRERSRAQLMLALYRAGRQIDALQRYRDGRALLVDHAGVEPGSELRGLEWAILTQDRALDLALAVRTDAPTASAPQAHRRWTRTGGATALLLAGVVGALIVVGHSGSAHALARIDASSAGAIDPGTNRLV